MFEQIADHLTQMERQVCNLISEHLVATKPGRDRETCDKIFGSSYSRYLGLCLKSRLASRAANFGRQVINEVLKAENANGTEYHKGALFADTGLAYFLCGNVDQYEYLLAMSDEEDVKTSGGSHRRERTICRATR